MNKKESVTIRMGSDNVERLRRYSRIENISQGRFIENLIEKYDSEINGTESISTVKSTRIEYLLRYENYFLKDKEKQVKESIKYAIHGKNVYSLKSYITIPIKQVINFIKDDFNIDEDLEKYIFMYWFSISYDTNKERYIVNEIFDIRMQEATKAKLNISRCKIALNLQDIKNQLQRYTPTQIIAEVESYLVEVTEDDEVLDKFFY